MIASFRQQILDAKVANAPSEAVRHLGFTETPSNEQILQAAQRAYSTFQPAVDATTQALVNSVNDAGLSSALVRLDGTNWASPGVSAAVVQPFFDSTEVKTALGVARQSTALQGFSVGVFAKTLPVEGTGMIGFGQGIGASGLSGLLLQLDIFSGIVSVSNTQNLQYGLWLSQPAALHDNVLGFFASTQVEGVNINMKILLTKGLDPYGFVVSSGAKVPLQQGLFAGSTSQIAE